jgi:hypothetical protein
MATESKTLECDLVMRGGITSVIVYPKAIVKLAETYKFRCVGGTSAGAIAATATAAGALGVRKGGTPFKDRFERLPEKLAEEIDGKTVLLRVFQPAKDLERVFAVLLSGLQRQTFDRKVVSVLLSLCRNYWRWAALGAAFVLVPFVLAALALGLGWGGFALLVLLAVLPLVLFAIIGAATGLVLDVLFRLPKNDFGICTGTGPADRADPETPQKDEAGVAPLTDWLHELFQSVAGCTVEDHPVTFGDLWGTENPLAERDIDLVLMTTNATRGVSHRLPFIEGVWGPLYFNEADFAKLFPAKVVRWLKEHSPTQNQEEQADADTSDEKLVVPPGLYRLPPAAKLPILLGARMSLSFPFLLSQVPLYTPQHRGGMTTLRRCLFSDGGLTSNFPIHFFDAPIPSRPTFGINLVPAEFTQASDQRPDAYFRAGRTKAEVKQDPWPNVWMPTTNSTGIQDIAVFHDVTTGSWAVIDFFMMLFDTARNWGDTELMAMPGYRDRIVHVALAEDEGGLNLSMPKEVVEAVGERGNCAGALLAARFRPTPKGNEPLTDPKTGEDIVLTWDNHRWIRFRSHMAALELALRRLTKTWTDSAAETRWRSYNDLLARGDNLPNSYRFGSDAQGAFAERAMQQLVAALDGLQDDETFDRAARRGGSPRPKPILRMMPSGSNDPRSERVDPPSGTPPATA